MPSSEDEAKSGYAGVGWKCRERIARVWYLCGVALSVFCLEEKRVVHGRIFLRVAGFEEEDLEECIKNVVNVPEDLVRFVAQFEVEPTELPVISTNDEMVARWMYIHRRYPF